MTSDIAALDLGSNTFRLMLAKRSGRLWADKRVYQRLPRLSERLAPGGRFAPQALARAWEALGYFDGLVRQAKPAAVLAGATMAARLAQDGPAFMAEIRRRFGWRAEILPGEEEARLTATGVLTELDPRPGRGLIFDIGGQSTEFVSVEDGAIAKTRSLPLGVVALTERFLDAPVKPGQREAAAAHVREVLAAADFADVAPGATLVGTAGSVTALAAILMGLKEYKPELVNNAVITKKGIESIWPGLAPMTAPERAAAYNLHPRRADAMAACLVEVLEIMSFFGAETLTVSDTGLLEALWLKCAGERGQ